MLQSARPRCGTRETCVKQRRPIWILASSIALIAIVLAGAIGSMVGALSDTCDNEIIATETSPNQKLKCVVFLRGCGATTPTSTQVSILPASEPLPNSAGNILVSDGEAALRVHWTEDDQLDIEGVGSRRTYLRQSEYRGVRIRIQ